MVKITFSDEFQNLISKSKDPLIKEKIEKVLLKIRDNPEIGKPMRYSRKGTREVYIGSFRLSYSYNKNSGVVFVLDLYHKDKQ